MKIIINKDGNITIDVQDHNTEEIAEIVRMTLNRCGIPNGIVYQGEED